MDHHGPASFSERQSMKAGFDVSPYHHQMFLYKSGSVVRWCAGSVGGPFDSNEGACKSDFLEAM